MSVSEFSFFGVEVTKYYAVHVHGYLSVFVCAFGSIANVFNMIVFTCKHMISPINTVLYFLALVDFIMLLIYLPEAWYFYLRPNSDPYDWVYYKYEWALFFQWQLNIAQISVNTSVWLTALVSLWRYIAIVYPLKNRIWCTMRNIFKMVALVFLLCVLLQAPAFFTRTVVYIEVNDMKLYLLNSDRWNPFLYYLLKVDFFLYSFFFRLLPAVVIIALSMKLLLAFSKIKKSRKNFNAESNSNAAYMRNEKQMTRTTLKLIILSVVCLIMYLPQSIWRLLMYFCDEYEAFLYENLLKEFISIVGLSNSAFTFVIYYAFNEQFRETFKALFGIKSTQEVSVMMRRNQISSNNTSPSTV